jgi:hypothetical protein
MPKRQDSTELSPPDRMRKVAAILARGLLRRRQRARAGGFMPAQKSSPEPWNSLEVTGETRLSVSDGTRGLSPQDDGDNV